MFAHFVISSYFVFVLFNFVSNAQGNSDPYSLLQAESMTFNYGTTIANSLSCPPIKSGYITDIQNEDYIAFYAVDFGDVGPELVEIHFADGNGYGHLGKIEIHLESPTGQLVATIQTAVTGDWCTFMVLDTFVSYIPTGIHNVYFVFDSPFNNDQVMNLDWVVFNTTVTLSP